jgi:hypothetical protein
MTMYLIGIDLALFNEVVYPQELEILYQRNIKRHKIMLLSVVRSGAS